MIGFFGNRLKQPQRATCINTRLNELHPFLSTEQCTMLHIRRKFVPATRRVVCAAQVTLNKVQCATVSMISSFQSSNLYLSSCKKVACSEDVLYKNRSTSASVERLAPKRVAVGPLRNVGAICVNPFNCEHCSANLTA